MSNFIEYKPMDVDHNVKAAVENLRKAYWSNDTEKVAKVFTEAESIIVSAICTDTYTVCKTDAEQPKGDLISRSALKQMIPAPIEDEYKRVHQIIDNAPPVVEPERLKGEWIKTNMSKCDYCLEWECFEGYQSGEGCFCMQRTEKLSENDECEFFNDVRKGGAE